MIEAHFGYFIFLAALFSYLNWRPLIAGAERLRSNSILATFGRVLGSTRQAIAQAKTYEQLRQGLRVFRVN